MRGKGKGGLGLCAIEWRLQEGTDERDFDQNIIRLAMTSQTSGSYNINRQ